MATLAVLRDRVEIRYRDPQNIIVDAAVVTANINAGYKNFCAETEFPFEETSTTLNFVAGDRSKALPANVFSVLSVQDTTNDFRLAPMFGWGSAGRDYPDSAEQGGAAVYRVIGGNLHLFPTPDAATSVEIFYSQEPPDLAADGDTPLIPTRYHDALVDFAIAQLLLDDGQVDQARAYVNSYNSYIEQAVTELRNARMETYPVPRDTFYEGF